MITCVLQSFGNGRQFEICIPSVCFPTHICTYIKALAHLIKVIPSIIRFDRILKCEKINDIQQHQIGCYKYIHDQASQQRSQDQVDFFPIRSLIKDLLSALVIGLQRLSLNSTPLIKYRLGDYYRDLHLYNYTDAILYWSVN